jgi:hypothetical protein
MKDKPEGYIFGRPSIYNPEMCIAIIEAGKEGKSLVGMCVAAGISRDTMAEWRKPDSPQFKVDFSEAVKEALLFSQQWWENAGQNALYAEKFQSSIYNKQMANRFREDHGDVATTKIIGDKENPLQVNNITDADAVLQTMLTLAAKAKASGDTSENEVDKPSQG